MERDMAPGTRPDQLTGLASNAGHGDQGGKPGPFGLKMIFNYPERGGALPYRDTELWFWAEQLTTMSASASRAVCASGRRSRPCRLPRRCSAAACSASRTAATCWG